MPNLIVMPGSKEFNETLRGVKPARKSPLDVKPQAVDLVGRTLMLNTAVAKRFQCGGFVVGSLRPMGTVTEETQQEPVRRALATGVLVDVSDKAVTKTGFKAKGGEHSGVAEEDTGKQVFLGRDRYGNLYAVSPKSKKQAKQFAREIKQTGTISSVDYETEASGIVGIIDEVVERNEKVPGPKTAPKKKPAKKAAKKNVSTRRRTGIPKRSAD